MSLPESGIRICLALHLCSLRFLLWRMLVAIASWRVLFRFRKEAKVTLCDSSSDHGLADSGQ